MKATQRRTPARAARQQRSKATVEAIFEATARVLESDGLTALTTNHVARLAGVSIGSLYEYFDNKDALLVAWCERHISEVKALADQMFSILAETPPAEAIELFIDGLLTMHQTRPKLKHVLMNELPKRLGLDPIRELDNHFERSVVEYFKLQRASLRDLDVESASYVICRAGKAVTMSFFLEQQPAERLPLIRAALVDTIKRALLP